MTVILPYSTRAQADATIATPVAWHEVKPGLFDERKKKERKEEGNNDDDDEYEEVVKIAGQ